MKTRTFYIVNLDSKRIFILVALFMGFILVSYSMGYRMGQYVITPTDPALNESEFSISAARASLQEDLGSSIYTVDGNEAAGQVQTSANVSRPAVKTVSKNRAKKQEKQRKKKATTTVVKKTVKKPVKKAARKPAPKKVQKVVPKSVATIKKPVAKKAKVDQKDQNPRAAVLRPKSVTSVSMANPSRKVVSVEPATSAKPVAKTAERTNENLRAKRRTAKRVVALQIGAFSTKRAAQRMVDTLKKQGFYPYIATTSSGKFAVRVGKDEPEVIQWLRTKLKKYNYSYMPILKR